MIVGGERAMERTKKKRTKVFTGCWTCRSRRLKCDEGTPSCQRCRHFGVVCEGYGVRLTWLINEAQDNEHSPAKSRASRGGGGASGTIGPAYIPRLSSPEVDGMLARIDDCPLGLARVEQVFSVFALEGTASTSEDRSEHESVAEDTEVTIVKDGWRAAPECTWLPAGTPPSSMTNVSPQTPRSFDNGSALVDTTKYDNKARDGNDWSHNHSNLGIASAVPSPIDPNRTDPASLQVQSFEKETLRSERLTSPSHSHLDLLTMPSAQNRLIHHWVTFTSCKLGLLDEPYNPCRSMMLPMALRGLASSSQSSNADVAIFHAICACAAYNLYELGGRQSEQDHSLALHHDDQALQHLRHNLAEADQHQDQSCAMAIMASITIEAISGTTRRWRAHVSGGLAYLNKLRSRGVDPRMLAAFQTNIVSMAIICGTEVTAELKSFLPEAHDLALTFPYYGASNSFILAQDRINTLARMTTTRPPAAELDAFELQLYLAFPAGPHGPPKGNATILHHMAQAFYYAGLVFFQREVKKTPLDSVQTLVEQGVKQLEGIEDASNGTAGSAIMWPALVLAAECGTPSLQSRIKAWFAAKAKLGFRNVVVLEELVACLWSRRDGGEPDVSWQDLTDEDRFDVFRL